MVALDKREGGRMKFTIFASSWKCNLLIYGTLVFLTIFAVFMMFYQEYSGRLDGESMVISLDYDTGINEVIEILSSKGVIENKRLFKLYCNVMNVTGLEMAKYNFRQSMPYDLILNSFNTPIRYVMHKVTIPEGFELRQIAQRIEETGLTTQKEFIDTCNSYKFNFEFLKGIPKRDMYLEGYLFPDTYTFRDDTTVVQIIERMLSTFEYVFDEGLREKAEERGMSIDQTVTLASIIEREAGTVAEMNNVSAVFHNRMKREPQMLLQSCATVQYILKERKSVLSIADTKIDSPYNTYIKVGLPVGPISNPGRAALEAALEPANAEYLYFVANNTGTNTFTNTYREHQAAMRQYGLSQ